MPVQNIIASVAKSAVFLWNWETFTLLPWFVLLKLTGAKTPQTACANKQRNLREFSPLHLYITGGDISELWGLQTRINGQNVGIMDRLDHLFQ